MKSPPQVIPLRCAACDAVLEYGRKANGAACAFPCAENLAQAQHRFAGRLDHMRGWSWWAPGKEGGERRAVHRLKYGGRASLGRALGQAMAEEAPVELWPNRKSGRLSPFPCTAGSNVNGDTTKVRPARRGVVLRDGNGSIAAPLPQWGVLLTRRASGTVSSPSRTPTDSMRSPSWNADDWEGVILMDDVITTGATLEAAWTALRTAWDGPIDFVTLLDAALSQTKAVVHQSASLGPASSAFCISVLALRTGEW